MKGQVIDYRKQNGAWVSGYFVPDCCSTQHSVHSRKYFNYCRNDSASIRDALAWDGTPEEDYNYASMREQHINRGPTAMSQTLGPPQNMYPAEQTYGTRSELQRHRSQENLSGVYDERNKKQAAAQMESTRGTRVPQQQQQQQIRQTTNQPQRRPQSAAPVQDPAAAEADRQRRQAKLAEMIMKGRDKSIERAKIQNYIKSVAPYTREMSNTRFRTFFNKECMEGYGRKNTNEPIGGIIYGNHLKTFNIGPHSKGNNPKHYQTHRTALNYGKRTKLNEEGKWRRLEKEFIKKLGLKDTNKALVQGKETIVQEVNPLNMHAIMNSNHEFAKQHKDQIRSYEKELKAEREAALDARLEEYKAQRNADKQAYKDNPNRGQPEGPTNELNSLADGDRIRRQVVYKMVDEHGNVRYGTDRHAMTCFVDMNFPENDKAYTEHLKQRMPIFPEPVKPEDMYLDQIRKQNYVDSEVYGYPCHYLVPNVDYSKVDWNVKNEKQRQAQRERGFSNQRYKQTGKKSQGAGAQQAIFANTQTAKKQQQAEFSAKQQGTSLVDNRQRQQQQQSRSPGTQMQRQVQKGGQELNYGKSCQCKCNCRCAQRAKGCTTNTREAMMDRVARDPEYAHKITNFARQYECGDRYAQAPQSPQREYDVAKYY